MTLQEFLQDCEHKGASVKHAFRRNELTDEVFETFRILPPQGVYGQPYYFTDNKLTDMLDDDEVAAAKRVLGLYVRAANIS